MRLSHSSPAMISASSRSSSFTTSPACTSHDRKCESPAAKHLRAGRHLLAKTSLPLPQATSTRLISRARALGQAGASSCAHYRKHEDEGTLPDDGAFPCAEDFFADAFATHVRDSEMEARYFAAGWLADGLEAHDLRDMFSHFDRLTPEGCRLACHALARAWEVATDVEAFQRFACHLAMNVAWTQLRPALEGLERALRDAPDLRPHRTFVESAHVPIREEACRHVWAQAAGILFPGLPSGEGASGSSPVAALCRAKRRRDEKAGEESDSLHSTSSSSPEPLPPPATQPAPTQQDSAPPPALTPPRASKRRLRDTPRG